MQEFQCRTRERKAVREMAFARGHLVLVHAVKLSQNCNLTVFSDLFSQCLLKRDAIQSIIQFITEPARTDAYTQHI